VNADLVIGELSANRLVPVVVLDDPADATDAASVGEVMLRLDPRATVCWHRSVIHAGLGTGPRGRRLNSTWKHRQRSYASSPMR